MSGGRATVAKGKVRQAGDICAVAPEGHVLSDDYFIECKNYRNLGISQFLVSDKGPLVKFWKVACREAKKYGRRPMLIAKQNGLPVLVIVKTGHLSRFSGLYSIRPFGFDCDVYLFDDLLGRAWQS